MGETTPVVANSQAEFLTAFDPQPATGLNSGQWRFDPTGSSASGSTGPGTNNDLSFEHTETSGGSAQQIETNSVARFATLPDETDRTLHLRVCLQGSAFNGSGDRGLAIEHRDSDSASWARITLIHGWAYAATRNNGGTVTDYGGTQRTFVADGGWIDVEVSVPDSATQVRLRQEAEARDFHQDIAVRQFHWSWPDAAADAWEATGNEPIGLDLQARAVLGVHADHHISEILDPPVLNLTARVTDDQVDFAAAGLEPVTLTLTPSAEGARGATGITAIEVKVGTDSWTDVSGLVSQIAWTRYRSTPDGRASSDTVSFRLPFNKEPALFRQLVFSTTTAVQVRLLNQTTVQWIGDLLPGRAVDVDGDDTVLTLEAIDRVQKLRARATSSYSAAGATLDTVATQLATRAGIVAADQDWPSDLGLITIGYMALEAGEHVWPVLEQVLWEHGWTLKTADDGTLTADRWWLTSLGTPEDIGTGQLRRLRMRPDVQTPAAVQVEWAETDTLPNVIVWEGTQGKATDGTFEPVRDFTTDGDEWPEDDAWLSYRTDWLARQAPLSRGGAVSENYQLLRVANQTVQWTGADIDLTTETHEALRSQLQWTAEEDDAALTSAAIAGDVTFRAYLRYERAPVTGGFGDERIISTRYLSSQAAAQRMAAALRDRHDVGAWQIRARMAFDDSPEPGDIVTITEANTGLNRTCVVLSRTEFPGQYGPGEQGDTEIAFQGIRAVVDTGADADGRVIPSPAPVVTLGPRSVAVPRGGESSWSDIAAEAAVGQPVVGDLVSQYQETGGTWTETRRWDGTAWSAVPDNATPTQGRGITDITKSGDTVTVEYSDGTTDTFTVEDGTDGDPGDAGTSVDVESVTTDDDGDTVIEFSDGTSVTIPSGDAGRGIDTITRDADTGVVTVTFDDNSADQTFTVMDGADGTTADRDFTITAMVDRSTSATWSDSAANTAIPNRITGDTVIQFRSIRRPLVRGPVLDWHRVGEAELLRCYPAT